MNENILTVHLRRSASETSLFPGFRAQTDSSFVRINFLKTDLRYTVVRSVFKS